MGSKKKINKPSPNDYFVLMPWACSRAQKLSETIIPQLYGLSKSVWETYSVFIPDFYNLRVCRNNKVQFIVEVKGLDWQVVKVIFHQKRPAGAQIVQHHLQEKALKLKHLKILILKAQTNWDLALKQIGRGQNQFMWQFFSNNEQYNPLTQPENVTTSLSVEHRWLTSSVNWQPYFNCPSDDEHGLPVQYWCQLPC